MLRILWFLALFYLAFKGLQLLFRLLDTYQRQRRGLRQQQQRRRQNGPRVVYHPEEKGYEGGDPVEYEELN